VESAERGVYALKKRLWRRRLARFRAAQRKRLVTGRVLVRMDAGIGNAVEATPLVQAIRTHWPRAHLTILPPHGDLLADWSIVDRVALSPVELEGQRFDHTFLTWCVERPGASAPFEPGRVHRAEGLFPHWQLRPEREVNLDSLRALGYDGPTPPLYVALKEPGNSLPDHAFRIALAPGGKTDHRWRHKRWPHFRALAETLVRDHPDAQVCIVGGPEDELPSEASQVCDLRGRHTLRETAWVLKQSRLVIGNDCGPTHIADAVLTPTLVLFGPTCEVKNGPRYRGETLSNDVACRPCQYQLTLLDSCADPRCMLDLTVETVTERVAGMLKAGS
jgi:ADP-heptose:LPS heptosyltransferase